MMHNLVFRHQRSTTDALHYFITRILEESEKGNMCGSVYLDLSKAFDTLDFDMILDKMNTLGIRGVANSWVKSYLTERTMIVKCHNTNGVCISEEKPIATGCPQGSILGPLIYICSTFDLFLNLEYCEGLGYADDTTIFVFSTKLNYIMAALEHDLNIITEWFNFNKLSLKSIKDSVSDNTSS